MEAINTVTEIELSLPVKAEVMSFTELSDCQLALIGGGAGDVVIG